MAALASRIFGSLVRARERAYAEGRLGVARLPAPVISIGNLSVGGSGKTPTVIALGKLLRARELRVDVLSRGYRRASRALAVAERGDEDVNQVGDEPRLIAQRLGAPVLVHPDRFRSGLEAERRYATQIHLLDDGFQHRQLARSFDLVLVSPDDLDGRLLPAGRLREPPAALARAHAIVWVTPQAVTDPEAELAAARERLAPFTPAPVFLAHKQPLPPDLPEGARPFAFCGLARPESFRQTLAELGIAPAGWRAFRDHHHYSGTDLRQLRAAARAAGADGFITTAKDAMNLGGGLENLAVVEIEMRISDAPALVALALRACGR